MNSIKRYLSESWPFAILVPLVALIIIIMAQFVFHQNTGFFGNY